MTSIIYDNLSVSEIHFLSNGCGPDAIHRLIPELGFTGACNRHDVAYWAGGTSSERRGVDIAFLNVALEIVNKLPWWSRWFKKSAAYTYYYAIRAAGWTTWHHGTKRTYEHLREAMRLGSK